MKNKITFMAVLGAAALALSTFHAAAQQVSGTTNDLLLCFETTTGQGSTINLEVDLGNFASPAVTSLNIDTDLVNDYGSGWASRTDLTWGVIATNFQTTPPAEYTLVGSEADTAGAGTSVGPSKQSKSAQSGASTDINNTYDLFNSDNATAGAVAQSETVDNTTGGSFGNDQTAVGDIFHTLQQGTPDDGSFSGNQCSVDLWESIGGAINPSGGTVTDINTITLNDAGEITVGTAAVPEPSTWASIALGAATLIGLRRRRKA